MDFFHHARRPLPVLRRRNRHGLPEAPPVKRAATPAPVPAPLCSGPGERTGLLHRHPRIPVPACRPRPKCAHGGGARRRPSIPSAPTPAPSLPCATATRSSKPGLPSPVYSAEPGSRLFAYKRGDLLCALNPGVEALALPLDSAYRILFCQGTAEIQNQVLAIQGLPF